MKIKDKVELAVMHYESGTSCKEAIEKVKAQYPNTTKEGLIKTSMKLYHLIAI